MQEGLSAPVVGPSTVFPRGYLWAAPIWYLIVAAALAISPWPPLWFRAAAAAGLLIALITLLGVLCTLSVNAFAADSEGVRLGLPRGTKRRGRRRRQARRIPWQQIERVRINGDSGGARLEIILNPAGAAAIASPYRLSPAVRAARWLLLAVIPFWYLTRPTGVTSVRNRPPRYIVRTRDLSVDELRRTLRALAPPEVAVSVLVHKA